MKKFYIFYILILLFSFNSMSQESVLQIFDGKTYNPVRWNKIENITFDESNESLIVNGQQARYQLPVFEGLLIQSGRSIPLIEIKTDEFLEEIPNKTDYKSSDLKLSGFGIYNDVETRVNVRGRGNSTWYFEKKPYRLKFDKKVSLCNLPSAKNYVLLANYNDCSLIQNVLAFKLGSMLQLPYNPQAVPVDVILNGNYKGSYLLTNKPGINAGSVDIDENNSIMWELDTYFDEDLKFMSPLMNLPVMVSDPDLTAEQFEYWKADFEEMEKAAYNRNASDFVDLDILARYLLVCEILKNDEIGFPKSVKLFKTKGEKYIFGPLWDFDTAMGKVWAGESYSIEKIKDSVWKNRLFQFLEDEPVFQKAINKYWAEIKPQLPELLLFIDDYADLIRNSAIRNQTIFIDLEDFDYSISRLKNWLSLRFEAIDDLYWIEK